jgi:hypothetical protein
MDAAKPRLGEGLGPCNLETSCVYGRPSSEVRAGVDKGGGRRTRRGPYLSIEFPRNARLSGRSFCFGPLLPATGARVQWRVFGRHRAWGFAPMRR